MKCVSSVNGVFTWWRDYLLRDISSIANVSCARTVAVLWGLVPTPIYLQHHPAKKATSYATYIMINCCIRCRRSLLVCLDKVTAVCIECFHMTSRRPCWCPTSMNRRPCWCPKPILWELNSFLMQTLSSVPINLPRCWPREWKHSIAIRLSFLQNRIYTEIESTKNNILIRWWG